MGKFRPLQESVTIVEKMLAVAAFYGENYPLLKNINDKTPTDANEVSYWEKRLHGYLKLANQKGVKIISSLRDESDKA